MPLLLGPRRMEIIGSHEIVERVFVEFESRRARVDVDIFDDSWIRRNVLELDETRLGLRPRHESPGINIYLISNKL